MLSKESDHPPLGYILPPSRTSSQKKAFKYFTKELEKYADLTSAPGKIANFSPTISPTPLSLNTVEELVPYRDQFLAAGLAVTSTDQRSPKGKEAGDHMPHRPDHPQLDGSPRSKDLPSASSPSSGETFIHFTDDRDPAALALIEERPRSRGKTRNPRETVRSRWFHRKAHAVAEAQPVNLRETVAVPTQPTPKPGPPHRPASPGAPLAPESPKRREQKVLEGTGQPVSVPVNVSRPAGRRGTKTAGKLPELDEDVAWWKPAQLDRGSPQASPKVATAIDKPTVYGHTHRPSGIRPPGCTVAVPLRSRSPSHVRNRHAPLAKPVPKHVLRMAVEELSEELMLDARHPPHPKHRQAKARTSDVNNASPPPPGVVTNGFGQPTDALMLIPGHSDRRSPPLVQPGPSCNNVLQDKANSISITPPGMLRHPGHSIPELPMTWKYAVGTPSSFEQALDDVVRKLDEMEPKLSVPEDGDRTGESSQSRPRDPSPEHNSIPVRHKHQAGSSLQDRAGESPDLPRPAAHVVHPQRRKSPATAALSPASKLKRAKAMRRLRGLHDAEQSPKPDVSLQPETAPAEPVPLQAGPAKMEPVHESTKGRPRPPPSSREPPQMRPGDTKSTPVVEDEPADDRDRDIDDRDVLKGLKLAVSAACDEDLDLCIRQQTGLRLRRFLADLKTFEHLESLEVGSLAGSKVGEKEGPEMDGDRASAGEAGLGKGGRRRAGR